MKVIFLDIDGVMNSVYDRFSIKLETEEHFLLLKELVDISSAKIVLSSSWRISERNRNEIQDRLKDFGMEFIDFTPVHKHGYVKRGEEIREWLEKHPEVENFVILDDEGDMCEFKEKHLVQTNMFEGFTKREMVDAWRILNGDDVPSRWHFYKKNRDKAERKFRKWVKKEEESSKDKFS